MVEVAIVQATTAGELPHSLDGVEFGTVSGQEVQGKVMGVLFPPRSVQAGGVITGIFRGGPHPPPRFPARSARVLGGLKEIRPHVFRGFLRESKYPLPPA